ncbi:MAG TPA: MFS transporter [Planctomycetota bacterium]
MLRTLVRSYRDAFSGLPRQVWVLALCLFVNRLGMMVVPFLELYLTGARGYAVDVAGRLVALYGVGSILGVSLGGRLADRFGPRRVQLVSLLAHAVFLAALGFARTTLAIGAAIVAASLAGDAFRPANGAAITAAVGPLSRARAFSLMSFAVCVGLTLGLPLGGELAELDFAWLFWIDAGTALVAAGVLFVLGARTPPPTPAERVLAAGAPSPWRDRPFLAFVLLQCAVATVLFQFLGALPVFLKHELGFTESAVGRALGLNALLIIVLEMQVVRRVERRSSPLWIALGSCLICAGYGLNLLADGALVALLSIAVWSVGEMLFFPLGAALASQRAPEGGVGRYLGVYHLAFAVALVLAPLTGTALYEAAGARGLWGTCLALGGLLPLAYAVLHRRTGGWAPRAPVESASSAG